MGPGCDQQAPRWQLAGSSGYKDREKRNMVRELRGRVEGDGCQETPQVHTVAGDTYS